MATVKVDSDGVPFWEQIQDTRLDYTIDWTSWMNSGDTVVSARWSSSPLGLAVTSGAFSSAGMHTGWVAPSAGNAGSEYLLVSKIFTQETRENKVKVRIKVES